MTLLFFYGTLKRGQAAHPFLAGQTFLREARTLPRYRLYDKGPFPCLVEDLPWGRCIHGELWEVGDDLLTRLDEYEADADEFYRTEVAVEGAPGPVQGYCYRGDVSSLPDCGTTWPPG